MKSALVLPLLIEPCTWLLAVDLEQTTKLVHSADMYAAIRPVVDGLRCRRKTGSHS